MRIARARVIALLFLTTAALAAAAHAQVAPSYGLLRENEDWSFLKDKSLRRDFWDPLKYIPLGPNGSYVTIGGDIREVAESVGNDNWGKQPYKNTFALQRYMFHSDWHFGEHIRVFVQFKSGLENARQGGARPIDEKKLDFEAAYLELSTSDSANWIALRVGRQEFNYGSGRLVPQTAAQSDLFRDSAGCIIVTWQRRPAGFTLGPTHSVAGRPHP